MFILGKDYDDNSDENNKIKGVMDGAPAYQPGSYLYVVPEDVQAVFVNSCRHRLVLLPKAGLNDKDSDLVLLEIMKNTRAPKVGR